MRSLLIGALLAGVVAVPATAEVKQADAGVKSMPADVLLTMCDNVNYPSNAMGCLMYVVGVSESLNNKKTACSGSGMLSMSATDVGRFIVPHLRKSPDGDAASVVIAALEERWPCQK